MLYGRDTELAAIDAAIASASARRGRAVFFVGEAGIGKSSLLAAARARAPENSLVVEGAAWESSGAPPFWPWMQVMRAAETELGAKVRELPGIAQLLGEASPPPAGVDPVAARFGLVAAVVRSLVVLSTDRPLVIVLDDLHAADVPSLELLDLACREVARAAIAIVGSWRDHELATRPEVARHLGRVGRDAIAPRRLNAGEVARWVGESEAPAIHAASEGNPLFVAELVRARRGGVVPRAIATVLGDHVALVSPETRDVLAAASVIGRDVDDAIVAAIAARDVATVERALREATAAGLGDPIGHGRWRFRHVLLRDHLYDGLPRDERVRLHRAAGEALARRDDMRAAHHLLAGEAPNAVAAARVAAARASMLYAFEDAAALLAAAARALETHAFDDVVTRIDVGLELSRARGNLGTVEPMRAEAVRAAELARSIGDAERFTHAALAYSAELASGRLDPVMIELLEAALVMLPPGDGSLRARATARLAAALVPPTNPFDTRPFELADEAIAMADRIADPGAKMYALRFNAHAHGFRRGLAATMPLVIESIALSDQLGCPLDMIEHRSWLANAHFVNGDLADCDSATDGLESLLSRMQQTPHYQWRMPVARAMRATVRGDYDEADRLLAIVRSIAREHDIDRARVGANFGGLSLALASRSSARAATLVDSIRTYAAMIGGPTSASLLACVLGLVGDVEGARRELAMIHFIPPIGLAQFAIEGALIVDDRRVLALAIDPLRAAVELAPIAYGPAFSLVLAPIDIALGDALVRLDRAGESIPHLERGLALARRLESPPFIARGAGALAAVLPALDPRVASLRDEVRRNRGVAEVAPTLVATSRELLEIARDGESVRVAWRGREVNAPASKGLDYLAALIARPSGELHVSELVGDEDRGDAGEMLDAKARAAYKARVDEVRAELADAEDCNDLGRIDRLNAELEMVTAQVVAATGLGGKSRRAASRVERARVNVQRRIRDAIQRLAVEDATLGRYLDATIRTGTFCSFSPLDA